VLFIENVGNLICPTAYDLGEDFKVVLLSVTEGEDKPFKYPGIFSRAEVAVITKADLLPHVPFRLDEVQRQIGTLRPGGRILRLSALSGEGMEEWTGLLEERLAAKRGSSKR
jgi:hydrogenase nickel incorporation protein HypB